MRPLNWIQWSTVILLFVVPALTVVMFLRVQDVQQHQNDALHTIICSISRFQANSPRLSPQQKHQDALFWENELHLAHLKPCQGG